MFFLKPSFNNIDVNYMNDCILRLLQLRSTDKITIIDGDSNHSDIDWLFYFGPNTVVCYVFEFYK